MLIFTYALALVFISVLLMNYRYTKKEINYYSTLNKSLQNKVETLQLAESNLKNELTSLDKKLSQSFEDPVTHLLAWQLFEDRINQTIKESERYQFHLGLLFVDIDDFKMINNVLGHKGGDSLLKEVAERLQTCIRRVDSITRFTKDTYVILLAQLAKPETAVVVAQRILQAVIEPFVINDQELFITVSIGIAIYPTDGKDAETLLRSAGQALQLAKKKGKFSYQFYAEKIQEQSQRELALFTFLNHENINKEFIIFYQPIVNVKKKSVIGMEAKLYLQHPTLGMIGPSELFNYADKQRKLIQILEWLFKNACRQFMEWQNTEFQPEFISISISLKQLENSPLIYRLSQIFQELNFDPKCLLLEINEGLAPASFDIFEKAFNMLKYMGVKIGVNNFGSSTFPLSFLKWIPLTYIKMGSIIISDMTNPKTIALIKSIQYLAQQLNAQVIVEDVNTNEQLNLLTQLNCYLLQGKLLGEQISQDEVFQKMKATTSFIL